MADNIVADDQLGVAIIDPYPDRAAKLWAVEAPALVLAWSKCESIDEINNAAQWISHHLDARGPLTNSQVASICSSILNVLQKQSMDLRLQTQLFGILSTMYRRYRKCPSIQPVDWKYFNGLLNQAHLSDELRPALGGKHIIQDHRNRLRDLIGKTRRFFQASANQEVLNHCWKNGDSPQNLSFFVEFAIFDMFMPIGPESNLSWVPTLIKRLQLTDPCKETLTLTLSLLSRAAKLTNEDLSSYLPLAFHLFIQQLPLAVGGATIPASSHASQVVWPKELRWLVPSSLTRFMAKFIVYSIGPSSCALSLLAQFMKTTATFFHPSNGGPWTHHMSDFLSHICSYFAKRYWQEYSKGNADSVLGEATQMTFLDIILPVATNAIYSKSPRMVYCAQDSLRHLCYLAPKRLFAALINDISENLVNQSQVHRTLSSLSMISSISHPFFSRRNNPSGSKHLMPFLWASLDHIDAVHFMKSVTTLSLLGTIFYSIPFLDGTNAMCDDDDDEEARHACLVFKEWALAFVERLCDMLKHLDTMEKQSGMDQGLARVLFRTCRPFFCSLSPETNKSCLSFLLTFVSEHTELPSRKYFGTLFRITSFGSAESTATTLLIPLIHRLTGPAGASPVDTVSLLAEGEIAWFLYLASSVVRFCGCSALVNACPLIASLLAVTIKNEAKPIRKYSRKLLRNTLKAMCTTYPTEFRPFPSAEWSRSDWRHWESWGMFLDRERAPLTDGWLEAGWHRPTPQELAMCDKITQTTLDKCAAVLANPNGGTHEFLLANLMDARAVLEGVISWSGNFEGKAVLPNSLLPGITPDLVLNPSSFKFNGTTLRTWFARMVLSVGQSQQKLRQMDQGTFKPELWNVVLTICNLLLNVFEFSESNIDGVVGTNTQAIRSLHEYASGHRCGSRILLIEQTDGFFMQRTRLARKGFHITEDVMNLVALIFDAAIEDYASVRTRAVAVLATSSNNWAWLQKKVTTKMVEVIRSRTAKENQVLGATELLRESCFIKLITSSWDTIGQILIGLSDCGHHKDDLSQAALISLFTVYIERLVQLPLARPEDSKIFARIISDLLILVNSTGGELHWRCELSVARFLHYLLRIDVPVDAAVLNFFLRGLTSDFTPMRRICLSALTIITCASPSTNPNIVTAAAINVSAPSDQELSSQVGNDGPFFESNSSGWVLGISQCPVAIFKKQIQKPCASQLNDSCLLIIEGTFSKSLVNIIQTLEDDHPKLQAQRNGGSAKAESGAANVIAKSIEDFASHRLHWPKTTLSTVSDALVLEHIELISAVTSLFPAMAVPILEQALILLARDSSAHDVREAHVTAAELWAGCAKTSKRLTGEVFLNISSKLSNVLTLGIEKCSPDMVRDWSAAIRFACSDVDPRRIAWLVDIVVQNALPEIKSPGSIASPETPSSQFKRLRFLQGLLIEFSWRSPSLNETVISRILHSTAENIPPLLMSPYSQVRQEVARVLSFVVRSSSRCDISLNFKERFSLLDNVVKTALCRLDPMARTHWLIDPNAMDTSSDYPSTSNVVINLLETTVSWVIFMLAFGDMSYSGDIISVLVPTVIAGCHHPNSETSALAKHALNLVAWSTFKMTDFDTIFSRCQTVLMESDSWHVRNVTLGFLRIFVVRHSFFLDSARVRSIVSTLEAMLKDPRIECRDSASQCLTALVACAGMFIALDKLIRRFVKTSRVLPTDSESILVRHSGVLGLSALVRSEPYDVLAWMPSVLAHLAGFINDDAPIGPPLQKFFVEFMRTHQDTWHIEKEKFSEDELTAVNEANIAPSYFA